MLSRSMPRFLAQAAFLIAVAAVAAVLHLNAWAIVVLMAAAFGAVCAAEWLATRDVRARRSRAPAAAPETGSRPEPPPTLARQPEPLVPPRSRQTPKTAPLLRRPGESPAPSRSTLPPIPADRAAQTGERPQPRPAPVAAAPAPMRPPPAPPPPVAPATTPLKPAPIPPPVSTPPVAPLPAPIAPAPAPPAPVAAPPAAPPPPPVVERLRWNVFDLQNRARQIAGRDPARDEEFSFLLLYLREFADVSGDLSEDFDTFVRESFPELVVSV